MADSVLMIAGQSNGVQMCTVPVTGCVPVSGTYVWQPNTAWRAMTSSDGAGMIEIANAQRQRGYDNVYVYNCSFGGSTVLPAACSPATPNNHWQSFASDSPLTGTLARVAAGGKIPQVVVWMEGEQAALYGRNNPSYDMLTNYRVCLGQLHDYLLGQWGATAEECVWMITPVGYVSYGDVQYVRQAQQQYATSTPGVFFGPPRDDLALLNEGGVQVHLTGPSCLTLGDRIAQGIQGYVMTDPQDKAAIASLQTELASIKPSLASIDATLGSIQRSLAGLQYPITNLNTRLSALEVIARDGPIGPYGEGGYSC